MDGETSGGGGSGSGWWPNASSSRPTAVVRELGPPAFLTKTYTIVDDPNTNSIISWGEFGNSFIIWDHLKFTAEILPRYFRHSNLSSFVYQLNNYGFRKIGCDHQWEYHNEDFQKGKEHLLGNMRRRGQKPDYAARKRRLSHSFTQEIEESKLEIKKLKKQQAEMELHIMAMEQEVKNAESKMKKLMAYWGNACDKIIAQKTKDNETDEAINPESDEHVDGENNRDQEEKSIPTFDPVSSTNANHCEANSCDYAYWNKIFLGDDEGNVVYEGEAGSMMAKKQAKIERDFEDLLTKKPENRDDEKVATTLEN